MATDLQFGMTKRGKRSLISNNFEFWEYRTNNAGVTHWRCIKYYAFKCRAILKTSGDAIVGDSSPSHTHTGNVATALSRKAVGQMKAHMTETIATPSSSQGDVVERLDGLVQMALPKRASLSRVLRRHRQIKSMVANGAASLPPIPNDMDFPIPQRFQEFLLYDSGLGQDRLLVFGDRDLLGAFARAENWIADGTFKVVPHLFFQLYSIHFEFIGGLNPAGVYCLLTNKSRATYERVLSVVKELVPTASPSRILTDFESAAMTAFREAYPQAAISGCYFHLSQSVNRKVNECGLKSDYEADNEIRGFKRCLSALSLVLDKVGCAFYS